jgi:hypothetical protein
VQSRPARKLIRAKVKRGSSRWYLYAHISRHFEHILVNRMRLFVTKLVRSRQIRFHLLHPCVQRLDICSRRLHVQRNLRNDLMDSLVDGDLGISACRQERRQRTSDIRCERVAASLFNGGLPRLLSTLGKEKKEGKEKMRVGENLRQLSGEPH